MDSGLAGLLRFVPDFPRAGVNFVDITTLLKNGPAFRQAIDDLAAEIRQGPTVSMVVGPEARGFLIGAPLAYALGIGFVPVRKAGKLPAEVIESHYQLEYGSDTLSMHRDAIAAGSQVVVADDLLATGGTVQATIELVERLGARVVQAAFLIELGPLGGRAVLGDRAVHALIKLDE